MTLETETIAYKHKFVKGSLILKDELIESDATTLKTGNFVTYPPPKTKYCPRTKTDYLLVGLNQKTV
jgi:hypothetical protein